jgi:acetyl-CoA synthetase
MKKPWHWYNDHVGDKHPVVDTWWQTETGGIMISYPICDPTKPTYATTITRNPTRINGRKKMK